MNYAEFFPRAIGHPAWPAWGTPRRARLIILPTGVCKTAAVVLAWFWNRIAPTSLTALSRSIHPFRDFNGRTVRLFLTELLRRLDFPRVDLVPESESGRARYFAALEAADRQDWQPLTDIRKSRFGSET